MRIFFHQKQNHLLNIYFQKKIVDIPLFKHQFWSLFPFYVSLKDMEFNKRFNKQTKKLVENTKPKEKIISNPINNIDYFKATYR